MSASASSGLRYSEHSSEWALPQWCHSEIPPIIDSQGAIGGDRLVSATEVRLRSRLGEQVLCAKLPIICAEVIIHPLVTYST